MEDEGRKRKIPRCFLPVTDRARGCPEYVFSVPVAIVPTVVGQVDVCALSWGEACCGVEEEQIRPLGMGFTIVNCNLPLHATRVNTDQMGSK